MKNHNDSEGCLPHVESLEKFCYEVDLPGLLSHKGRASAIVDEGKFEDGDVYRRRGSDQPEPLGSGDLYKVLRTPVCTCRPACKPARVLELLG
jgi:hypothetical protein